MKINGKLSGAYSKAILFLTVCVTIGIILAVSGTNSVIRAENDAIEESGEARDLDVIVINNEGYEKHRRGPVKFAHREHAKDYDVSCWECHHNYQDGKNIYSPWDETIACAECHDPTEKQGKAMKLQTAYHLNCKTCHRERAIFGDNPLEYRKCDRCHERAE